MDRSSYLSIRANRHHETENSYNIQHINKL